MQKKDKVKGRMRKHPLGSGDAPGGYPGGKNGAGVYQRLINQIPPHEVYIEPFLGSGAVMRMKRPAKENFGIEIDPDVFGWWKALTSMAAENVFRIINADAISILSKFRIQNSTFIYCDPPYVMSTRKSGPLYKHEYTDHQHVELLELLLSLNAMVMITGYRHAIYDKLLKDWRRIDYMAPTRHGQAKNSAWMNYPEPTELHDYSYLGKNFRERERIKRKIKRQIKRLEKMPILEKNAILDSIQCQSDRIASGSN